MTEAGQGGRTPRKRTARVAEVLRTSRITPHMVRVVLGGEGLAGFPAGEFTDHYVKLQLPPAGASYQAPYDADELRGGLRALRQEAAVRGEAC